MTTATISIEVDSDAARAFAAASAEERRKLELLLALRLRELTSGPPRPLREIMDEIGANAESRGLTPEILDSLLHDE
jgi:ferritin-like protein